MLHTDIKESLKEAMKAKDSVRVTVVKGMIAAFTNEACAKKLPPDTILDDETALVVITRLSKQRKDSIEQFESAGRPELAETEKAELAILETYLPEMMGEDEVRKIVEAKIAELGIGGKSDQGKLMSALMGELKGKADGAMVKSAVESLLQ